MVEKYNLPKSANSSVYYVVVAFTTGWPCVGEGLQGGQCGVAEVSSRSGSRGERGGGG